MPVVRARDVRRHVTPNAVMTTLASPAQGRAELALWRVEMTAGQRGPEHTFDVEQTWTVVSGGTEIELDGETHALSAGDTIVLPAGAFRRVTAGGDGVEALVACRAGARARVVTAPTGARRRGSRERRGARASPGGGRRRPVTLRR